MFVKMSNYPTNYFAANKIILKFGGMWIPNKKKSFRKWFFFLIYNSLVGFYASVFFPSEILKITDTYSNTQHLIEHSGRLLIHSLCYYKVFRFFCRRKQIFGLVEMLEDSKFHYEPMGDFQPGKWFQQAKKSNTKFTFTFFIIGILVPTTNVLSAGSKFALRYTHEDFIFNNVSCTEILPYYSRIPFATDSKKSCGFGLVYQAIPMIFCVWETAAFDTLFTSILGNLKAHLLSVRKAFETIRERSVRKVLKLPSRKSCRRLEEHQMNLEMKKCTQHLQAINEICGAIENIYNSVTLFQVLVTLFVLVSCLYMVSTVPILSGIFAAQMTYLLAMMYQLGIYCWFGNEITLMCENIPQSIYQSDWYSASLEFKQSMLINMIRMKKSLILTVGKFSPLTLTTFAAIVKASYQFFAVLKNKN